MAQPNKSPKQNKRNARGSTQVTKPKLSDLKAKKELKGGATGGAGSGKTKFNEF